MSYISSIGTANPDNRIDQTLIARFMARAMQLTGEEERRLNALYRSTGIDSRHSVLSDYAKLEDFQFYSNTKDFEPFPTTRQRLEIFRKEAFALSLKAIENCFQNHHVPLKAITHLIVVSCTGMYAPGLDIDLVRELQLNSFVRRTAINFMGCYAAFNAIKLADAFCKEDSQNKVLIVCTELCSLHFQKENTEDNWLANALFADGSAALLMEATSESKLKLKPVGFHCYLATEAEKDMAWTVGDFGFEMKLSTYVPEAIQKGISQLTATLLSNFSDPQISFYAIHPGGRRILEVIEAELNLSKQDLKQSYSVLRKFGNMSSPTVLFVMKEIMQSLKKENAGQDILSFAFGPGLTLESMLLKIQFD
jgi:prepilin-type processing-associated H-X9-DG protein